MKKVVAALCIILAIGLTGCGEPFPEMTDEEYGQVVQFASAVVMKHSNNGVEKLATVTPRRIRELDENPYAPVQTTTDVSAESASQSTAAASTASSASSAASSKAAEEKASAEKSTEAQTDKSMDSSSDKKKDDASTSASAGSDADVTKKEDGQETDIAEGEDTTEEDDTELEGERITQGEQQKLLNGLTISYTGYTVTSAYPDDSYAYALDASPGKKLLILGFRISNLTGSDRELDMIKNNPHFQIIVNGENLGYTLVTVLDNDLSSYKGTIPADSKETMILAIQVDAGTAKSIQTLGMIASMGDDTQTIILEE